MVLEHCFQVWAPNKLSLGYGKVMMKAIRGDSTENIYLIFLYTMHYSGIYFFVCVQENYEETNEKHSKISKECP